MGPAGLPAFGEWLVVLREQLAPFVRGGNGGTTTLTHALCGVRFLFWFRMPAFLLLL